MRLRRLELRDRLRHLAVVGMHLRQRDVRFHHVVRGELRSCPRQLGPETPRQRRLHVADRLLPQVADLTRALIPVLGLVDAVERGVRFGEPVDADRAAHAADRGDGENLATAHRRGRPVRQRAARGQSRSACAARRDTAPGGRSLSSVAQLRAKLGQRDRPDQPAPLGRGIGRLAARDDLEAGAGRDVREPISAARSAELTTIRRNVTCGRWRLRLDQRATPTSATQRAAAKASTYAPELIVCRVTLSSRV